MPNCSVLLVADCSVAARFAIFVSPIKHENDIETFVLEVHIDDRIVKYIPYENGNDFIQFEDSSKMSITSQIYPFGENIEFR